MKTAAERFWAKVSGGDVETCWIWTGGTIGNGKQYGLFIVAWPKKVVAHRWAYESLIGPVPPGLDLDHLCRNRACVNPWHLDPVTRKVNLNRGLHANSLKTHCPYGHPYSPENTLVTRRGSRECRTCRRERATHKLAAPTEGDVIPTEAKSSQLEALIA